ncbi:MAG: hypothetical protein ACM3VX_07830 [Bacteroidota bacterium]
MERAIAGRLAEDPRPDLTADHNLWKLVLSTAQREGSEVLGLLHGFRCLGAVLQRRQGSRGVYLHLAYQPACREIVDAETGTLLWHPEPQDMREVWLEPHRHEITRLFRAAIEQED